VRRVTYSRNVTLSGRDGAETLIDGAARRGRKAVLVSGSDVDDAVWLCERALERGLLAHTNLGALPTEDLARLREVAASQGLAFDRDAICAAGDLRIPVSVSVDAVWQLEALAAVHAEFGHVQEVIVSTGSLVATAAELLPSVAIQVASVELIEAGGTDLGAIGNPHQVRKTLQPLGYALTERLCTYPQFLDPEWMAQSVLDVVTTKYWSFIPRRGSGRRQDRVIRRDLVVGAIAKGREGRWLGEEELTALFAEQRPEAIEDLRQAADELRAELVGDTVTFVVNRNINVSNVCIVGCAFCGFGQGKRSPDAYQHPEEEYRARIRDAVEYGASELCIQSGIHPDWGFEEYLSYLRIAKDEAPHLHLHAYSPMEIAHIQDVTGLALSEIFARLRDAGLGSTPGTAAEVLHDGVRERISPNKLPVARWVEVIEASHRAGLRSTSTVMFGHIEEPWELAEHMRVVRTLQEKTGGFTEFVPLSFIPFMTLLGRTHGVEEISREENLKHTAVFRLALGRTVANLQASWVKMGLETATESLRWGVNDLGGTLMEESISRLAGSYHGTRLDPPQLIAAAHAAGRPAAERTTLYERVGELSVAAA
jgi:FO synthase